MGVDRQKTKRKYEDNSENRPPSKQFKSCVRFNVEQATQWTSSEVLCWLTEKGFKKEIRDGFEDKYVDGRKLTSLNEDNIKELDLDINFEDQCKILEEIDILKESAGTAINARNVAELQRTPTKMMQPGEETKVFNDPIHGHIEMHPLCVNIIDTRQFQRLRYIKQLGGCHFVFPGASNNRFEHSLGVSHLAGELVRTLHRRQPELNINHKDILCVEIAGLCHDLGHGPFSHMFDGRFIPAVKPGTQWKHETASVQMFYHLIKSNKLEAQFKAYGLFERDIKFIAEQIEGPRAKTHNGDWPYEGRLENKSFLYEIVANKRNGIDVDKWDYFARDCHYLGIKNNFDHARFMKFVRVIHVDGQKQICSRDKEVEMIYEMFHARLMLHRRAYQHKNKMGIEAMICEAFAKANKFLTFEGKDGKMLCLADTIDDMVAYARVNDSVYHQILNSNSNQLAPARKILERIETRDLYKCVGQTKPKPNTRITMVYSEEMKMREDLVTCMTESELGAKRLSKDDIIILIVNLDYGMKDKNPMDNVRFYKKSNPDTAIKVRKDQVSEMLPERFSDQNIRVYSKKTDETSCRVAEKCFNKWCELKELTPPKGADMEMEMTPCKTGDNVPQVSCSSNNSEGECPPAKMLNFEPVE